MKVESLSNGQIFIDVTDENPIVIVYSTAPIINGTTDHADLTNLDYASSGHTGFEPAKGTDDNYVTDAEKIKLSNLSGTNTGDQNLAPYELKSEKGAHNGYAPLDAGGKVPSANLPTTLLIYKGVWNAFDNDPLLPEVDIDNAGFVYNVGTAGTQFGINWKLGDWAIYNDVGQIEKSDNSDDVVSVNGQQGIVTLDAEDVGASPDTHLHAGQVITPDGVAFDTVTPYVVANPAEMGWNAADGTIDLRLLNSTTLQVGQELHIYGKASEAILNGDICQFAGVQGNHILIKKAVQAEIAVNPYLIVGIATQNINSSDFGYITWFGKINGVYTTGLALADLLYFDSPGSTAGAWTKTPPAAPYRKILMAAVIKLATGASENGVIMVRPTFGTKFADLDDVDGTDTTIADTDTIPKKDTTGILKFVTWANIKTLLTTWANGKFVSLAQETAQTIGSFTNRILKSWHTDIDANKLITSKIISQNESVQILYVPNQSNFIGTLFLGDGGDFIDNTGVDAGDFNTGVGIGALKQTTISKKNTAVGYNALNKATSGWANTAVGYNTLASGVGTGSLALSGTGVEFYANTAIGEGSMSLATTGSYNTAVGNNSLLKLLTGKNNVAIGVRALNDAITTLNSVSIGFSNLRNTTTGGYHVSVGQEALISNLTAIGLVAIGYQAGYSDISNGDSGNLYLGFKAGFFQNTGTRNTIVGYEAGKGVSSFRSYYATLLGYRAGDSLGVNNEGNVGVGYLSLQRITTGTYNVFLGANTGANSLQLITATNSIAIGKDAYTTKSNQAVIGNTLIAETILNGDILTTAGKYFYQAASPTADTVNDTRFYNNAGTLTFQKCTVANATKGGGTWVNIGTM